MLNLPQNMEIPHKFIKRERIIMARKELGLDSMGIQKTMRFGDYMADAGGQFTLNAISGLVGAITYF